MGKKRKGVLGVLVERELFCLTATAGAFLKCRLNAIWVERVSLSANTRSNVHLFPPLKQRA